MFEAQKRSNFMHYSWVVTALAIIHTILAIMIVSNFSLGIYIVQLGLWQSKAKAVLTLWLSLASATIIYWMIVRLYSVCRLGQASPVTYLKAQ